MRIHGWIIALLGLWEAGDIVAPFVPGFGTVQAFVWNHIIVGIFLMVVGAWAALTRNVGTTKTMDWLAAGAGAWLVIASFILGNPVLSPGLGNDVAVGLIVLILASASGLRLQRRG